MVRWPEVFLAGLIFTGLLIMPWCVSPLLAESPATDLLAEINGETITAKDLDQALGAKLAMLQEEIYSLKRQHLDTLIAERLLAQEAAKRSISIPALLDAEVTAKVGLVTETEVEVFYQANKSRLRGDEADVRQKIRASLQQQKLSARREQFVDSLRSQANVQVYLPPPPVSRLAIPIEGAPIRGISDAPVTLVEFSDFHCPFCKRAQPILEQILKRYPRKVRLVFRDFPLDNLHPQARQAAEAARCAHDQHQFWAYHDLLFTHAPQASSEALGTYAEQVGLAMSQFQVCLSEGIHQAAVQKDRMAGTKLGITSTPMFFINGRPLSGALPLERFVQVIEEELARSSVANENVDSKR
jgi:protein-disulfide isomerase